MKRLHSLKTVALIPLLLITMMLAACQGSPSNEQEVVEGEATPIVPEPTEPAEAAEAESDWLVEMAKAELAQLLGIDVGQITVENVTTLDISNNTYSVQLRTPEGALYEYHAQNDSVVLVSDPLPPAPVDEETAASGLVPVDYITLTMLSESQVQLVASGNLLQGCDVLNEPEVIQEGQTFTITLTRNTMIQRPCTDALVPFEETILLDTAGLPAGEYRVEVNGVSEMMVLGEKAGAITPEQITFDLNALATVVVTETMGAAEATADLPGWAISPEHIQFTFEDYILTDVLQAARLLVYPVSDYEAVNETAAAHIAQLRTLLAQRPETLTQTVPFLPLIEPDPSMWMWTRADFLDFQTGTGIRYLAQYAQATVPVNNQELFYTFQGLTEDEAYYVTAVFPINHPDLPGNAGSIPTDFEETFDEYLLNLITQLDEAEEASFIPNLSVLDAFVQSIAIESEESLIQDAATLRMQLRAAGATVGEADPQEQPFFPIQAQLWQINEAEVQVFEFESEQQQQAVAALIEDNGYVINNTAVDWTNTPHFWATGRLIVLYVGEDEAVLTLLTSILGKPLTSETSLLEGAYPAAVSIALELFSQETGINTSAIEIISVAQNEWPSGCLGLEEEGEVCTLAIVSGLQIIAQAQGNEYEIRTDETGTVMRWQILSETIP